METVWEVLNSPAAIALVAVVVVLGLNRLYAKKPLWQRFEGSVITAVKWAETSIDDETTNRGLARLDTALRYVINVFREVEGRRPTEVEEQELKEAIQVSHATLEASDLLRKGPKTPEQERLIEAIRTGTSLGDAMLDPKPSEEPD